MATNVATKQKAKASTKKNLDSRLPSTSSGQGRGNDKTTTKRVTLLGAGTVNGALARIIANNSECDGFTFEIAQVFLRDASRKREGLRADQFITDPSKLDFAHTDVVVEALGGVEPARTLVLRALKSGIPVVTANKTLIAYHGEELFEAAREAGVPLRFEAAVGGAVPCIRVLRDALKGVKVRRIYGVLNGTSHFILNEIRTPGISLETAVKLAQQHGYAEQDPSADLEGHDAAQKLAILCWGLSGKLLDPETIPRVELPTLSPDTVVAAAHIGFTVKPLAALSWDERGKPEAWIAPAAVPSISCLAATQGAEATVVLQTDIAGTFFLSAPGAGGGPTASALFDDTIEVLRGQRADVHSGKPERVSRGGADDPREWVVHAPLSSGVDGAKLVRHIADCEGRIERFENLGEGGWIAHVAGIAYQPRFTEPLTKQGACVLEVVR
ncbi:MAG: homoserine dehydrogenase [Planctomycetes bacterium]|nr:homoserine dehydrogenase [Planctomycetota bacterium]NUQ35736.1 homoserine dehydrogenase [Planctomycetaceae bacterium]